MSAELSFGISCYDERRRERATFIHARSVCSTAPYTTSMKESVRRGTAERRWVNTKWMKDWAFDGDRLGRERRGESAPLHRLATGGNGPGRDGEERVLLGGLDGHALGSHARL